MKKSLDATITEFRKALPSYVVVRKGKGTDNLVLLLQINAEQYITSDIFQLIPDTAIKDIVIYLVSALFASLAQQIELKERELLPFTPRRGSHDH